jgi:hypothetical protein
LLDDLGDRRGYSHLKEEALDRIKWRNRFGRGCGPFVWQITDEWIVTFATKFWSALCSARFHLPGWRIWKRMLILVSIYTFAHPQGVPLGRRKRGNSLDWMSWCHVWLFPVDVFEVVWEKVRKVIWVCILRGSFGMLRGFSLLLCTFARTVLWSNTIATCFDCWTWTALSLGAKMGKATCLLAGFYCYWTLK